MKTATKMSLLTALLLVAVAAVMAQFVFVRQVKFTSTSHTLNSGELIRDVLVGQTFTAPEDNLSGLEVMFANYANRSNTAEIKIHLRETPGSREDIRVGTVNASELGDNQFHRFEFEPIENSAGKQYFFFIVSPDSVTGNAVTVDLNTQDPYHLGSAYVVRGQGSGVTAAETLAKSGKPTWDVVFGTVHTVPLRVSVVSSTIESARSLLATWPEQQGNYMILLGFLSVAVAFVALSFFSFNKVSTPVFLIVLVAVGASLRWLYASKLPLTNDEGNYLYDAASALRGILAGGDGYVKAPLVILWVSFWEMVTGSSVVGARLSSVVIGSLTAFPLYMIGYYSGGKKAGLLTAAAWLLLGAPIVGNIYIHTQSFMIFIMAAALAVLWHALRAHDPAPRELKINKTFFDLRWFLIAGILFGLAVISRKSALAVGLVPLFLLLVESNTWRRRTKHIALTALGFIFVVGVFLSASTIVYGWEGFWEGLGANSAEDGIFSTDPAEAEQVTAYSLRGMTPFFRESLPLILLALIGWGLSLETLMRQICDKIFSRPLRRAVRIFVNQGPPKMMWIFPSMVFFWAWGFFFEYDGGIFHELGGMRLLWILMAAAMALVALWPQKTTAKILNQKLAKREQALPHTTQPNMATKPVRKTLNTISALSQQPADPVDDAIEKKKKILPLFVTAAIAPLWILGLVIFYTNWIKFHANYLVEFLVPLSVMSGYGLWALSRRLSGHAPAVIAKVAVLVVVVWATLLSSFITYNFEHTGTFDIGSVKNAAAWAKENIPADETIFTGAAAIPYVSGHRTALDIAHPRWYAYEFTRKDTERLNTFLPPAEEMVQAFRDTTWVLYERQTGFSFLMEYSEIEKSLFETGEFELIYEEENGSNPLQFYLRVKPFVAPS